MTRPIEFRAWDNKNNRMLICERIYSPYWVTGYVPNGECDIHCNDFEIMQFTGLLDKNEKKIFEGDSVKYSYSSSKDQYIDLGIVQWSIERAAFVVIWAGDGLLPLDECKVEIIGNIYENRELIEGK